jgi:nucleoside-diphosphate-sugar epimerase
MRLLVTGASGFLGRYVVTEAIRQGDHVRPVVRPDTAAERMPWRNYPGLEVVSLDLRSPHGIAEALRDIDVVVHLAARKEGDLESQLAGTVSTARHVLEAMVAAGVSKLVAVSSFSVFDYLGLREEDLVDEDSPTEREPERRDFYARTKLLQEQLVREFHEEHTAEVTILRPGVIYGRGSLWNARLGIRLSSSLWLRIGSSAQLPLIYVENCAQAVVAAAHRVPGSGPACEVLNLVDDDLPTRRTYVRELRRRLPAAPRTIGVAWPLAHLLAATAAGGNRLGFRGRLPLPPVLTQAGLHARFKPLRYTNRRARERLGWEPRYSLAEALDRCCSDIDLFQVPAT